MNKQPIYVEKKSEIEKTSEKFQEIVDSVLQDDDEVDYPEYDDVTTSF